MKKLFIGIGIFLLIIIGTLILLPVIFKEDLQKMAIEEANKNLKAEVSLGGFDLSLIRSFPNFSILIEDIVVKNEAPFEGVELANIGEIELTVDVMSVIYGEQIQLNSFVIGDASLHVIVKEDGTANYDIAMASDSVVVEEEPADTGSAKFNLAVNHYELRNINLIYDDAKGGVYTEIKELNHVGDGDFTQDIFDLNTKTDIAYLEVAQGGVAYLPGVETEIVFDLKMDMPNEKYTFGDNSLRINALTLGFEGWVQMLEGDAIDMDLKFGTDQTEFKSILSLIPAVYAKDFEAIETSGSLKLDGTAKGKYEDPMLPAFTANLVVADAMFHYPELPKEVKDIQIDAHVSNPGGSDDATVVELNKFHIEMAGNPVDAHLVVKTPVSDPDLDGWLKANIDLASVGEVMPLEEGEEYAGKVISDIAFAGQLSSIENEQYQDFQASGNLKVMDFLYEMEGYQAAQLSLLDMDFSPQQATVNHLDAVMGESDLSFVGKVDNILGYYFSEVPLEGDFTLTSNKINLDELMGGEEATEAEEPAAEIDTDSTALEVIEVPADLDLTLNVKIGKILYDLMDIDNLAGKLTVADQRVAMENLNMNMLDGGLGMSGYYETPTPSEPGIDFDLKIDHFDLEKTAATFNSVTKLAPIIESMTGDFSGQLKLNSALTQTMELDLNSVNGSGVLQTYGVKIENSGVMLKIADKLKQDDFKSLPMSDANLSFQIQDGKVMVEPFDFTLGNLATTFGGDHYLSGKLEYDMIMTLPAKALGGAATGALNSLASQANNAVGSSFSVGDEVNVEMEIGGTMDDPQIRPKFLGTGKGAKDAAKAAAKEAVQKQVDQAKAKAKAEADKLKAEANKKKQEAEAAARAKAQTEKERLKREAEKEKKKLEEEAKKKLKGLFGK